MFSKVETYLSRQSFFIGFLLSLSLLWPLFYAPYFSHQDDLHLIRLYEMNKCVADKQIPCRWVPDMGGLYGYPLFNYYGPLPYYIGEFIYLLTSNLIFSAKMLFAIGFLGSYIFMYLCARKLWGNLGGLISGVFYSFAPYHALDFYVRGDMGELWALMFFPAIIWSLLRLKKNPQIKNVLVLSFFVGCLVATHNLSAMIFMPFAGILFLYFFLRDRKNVTSKKFFVMGAIAFVFGILLSAFYWLPALLEKQFAHLETLVEGYFSVTEHFKGLKKLFIDRFWGYGSSQRDYPGGPVDGLSYQIGIVHILGWAASLFAAGKLWKSKRAISYIVILLSVFAGFAIFMINPRSDFLYQIISPLQFLQFPWRFLMLVIFFISFLVGVLGSEYFENKWKGLFILLLLIGVVAANFSYFKPEKFIYENDQEAMSGANWDRQIKRSIFDYLPIYAHEPPASLADKRYEILTGTTQITDFKEGTNWFSFNAKTQTHSIVRISQYYFPNWTIKVDGNLVKVESNNNLGLMTIILGVGNHMVDARLHDTPIRSLANFISFVSMLGFLLLLILNLKSVKKWMAYYIRFLKT